MALTVWSECPAAIMRLSALCRSVWERHDRQFELDQIPHGRTNALHFRFAQSDLEEFKGDTEAARPVENPLGLISSGRTWNLETGTGIWPQLRGQNLWNIPGRRAIVARRNEGEGWILMTGPEPDTDRPETHS